MQRSSDTIGAIAGFEAAIIADYDAETAVERELVLRALKLWKCRTDGPPSSLMPKALPGPTPR